MNPYLLDGFEYEKNDKEENGSLECKLPLIASALETHRFVIVTGDTGCGKTTQIPKYLMNRYENIVCTQPRRLAVMNTARRIAKDLHCPLGTLVGYSVRFQNRTSENTRLKIVTDGILLKEITLNRRKLPYDLIIIDEAHERSLNIECLLTYLKNTLRFNGVLPTRLLIMSATLYTKKFVDYFFQCPLVEIKQKRFPIDLFHLKEEGYYVDSCVETTEKIVQNHADGDILVFLTGRKDIDEAYVLLSNRLKKYDVTLLKLFSSLPTREQNLIYEKTLKRKIILSTNVAETSVTLPNVKFVVDSGKVKSKRASPVDGIDYALVVTDISKAQAKQRAGRVGRTQPGVVYRMYGRTKFMEENPVPEIMLFDLSGVILFFKKLGMNRFDFIDPPPTASIRSSVAFLKCLDALDDDSVTEIGMKMSNVPLDPAMSRILYEADRNGSLREVATILPFLINFHQIYRSSISRSQYLVAKETFSHPDGNFFESLNIYEKWSESRFARGFLNANLLDAKTMYDIKEVRKQLLSCFRPGEKNDDIEKMKDAFCCGYFQNVAKKMECGKYIFRDNLDCYMDAKDPLFKKKPNFVLFYKLRLNFNDDRYMVCTLEIDENRYLKAMEKYATYKRNVRDDGIDYSKAK